MRRTLLSSWLIVSAATLTAGCGGGGTTFAPVGMVDGSTIEQTVVDGASRVDRTPEGGRSGTDGSSGDSPWTGGQDGGDSDGGAGFFEMTVTVESPMAGAVAKGQQRFTPEVLVTVTSSVPAAGDAIANVTAALIRPVTNQQAAIAVLGQVRLETVPETGTLKYHFGDKPMDLSPLESGPFNLVVTARTVGGAMKEAAVSFIVDAGPTIRIASPQENRSFRGSAPVDVTITDDFFAPIKDVQMTLGQWPLTFVGPGGAGTGQYTTTIDFNGQKAPIEGDQLLTVRATNQNDTKSTVTRRFVADSQGPAIVKTVPQVGQLVGKVITVSAEITDPAGVLDSSVIAVIANTIQVNLDPPAAGSKDNVYRVLFDTQGLLDSTSLFPTISFRASDVLGNESSVGYEIAFDNTPPLSDLDPPQDFRALYVDILNNLRCSWEFDPVGPDASDDGDVVAQLFDIRARIEDQGNTPQSGVVDFTPIAGVPLGNAQLLILDDISQPLLVDTDGDKLHHCDAINPLLTPTTTPVTSRDALLIQMTPISPVGGYDVTDMDPNLKECLAGGALLVPQAICNTVYDYSKTIWRVFPDPPPPLMRPPPSPHSYAMTLAMHYASDKRPAIWTIPPQIDLDSLQCAGRQFDSLANSISDGWACLAVLAIDGLGNRQVSKAMRLCLDHDGDGKECPHKKLGITPQTTPLVIETLTPHGYSSGDAVRVSDVLGQTPANGRWIVNVVDAFHLALLGSQYVDIGRDGFGGWVVKESEIPDCTGTQTGKGPPPVVSRTPACSPWRLFPNKEKRIQ